MKISMSDYSSLPIGRAPQPVPVPHFPNILHAVIWRNWDVVAVGDLARVLKGTPEQIRKLAYAMGLPHQRSISPEELRRNHVTLLHRNWHLLPYDQLCLLLGWDAAKMQFTLNEDDFLYIKFGGYKPECPPVFYQEPDEIAAALARQTAAILREEMGTTLPAPEDPLYGFIGRFNQSKAVPGKGNGASRPFRMVYPYFLRFGDPLVGDGVEDLPEGYLAELSASGVNAIWLQGILNTLAPWELAPELARSWEERLNNLNLLVERCLRFDIEVLLYLNEPRAMPPSFFEKHPHLRGVDETPERAPYSPEVVALCTSTKVVQDFLIQSVRHVFEHVPGLGGIMVITYSENLTNCYSREYGATAPDEFALRSVEDGSYGKVSRPCPRCEARGPATVNSEVCALLESGMRLAGSKGKFILYSWSMPEAWMPEITERLPDGSWLLCVSEFGVPFTRGDYSGKVNEYSISVVGPSVQSLGQWKRAAVRGLKTAAKIQAANTFEISSIPYIPALRLVAQHLANISEAGVDGLMLGWTAGGSPSPNLEIAAEFARSPRPGVQEAMANVARRRFGEAAAPEIVRAWNLLSDAYEEFPFDISICYNGPQSLGPANLLFAQPTGFPATMVTFPFDDLEGWRGPYSEETLQSQFQKLAKRWQEGVEVLDAVRQAHLSSAAEDEWRIAEVAGIHFQSTANQIRFIRARLSDHSSARAILRDEIELARRLYFLAGMDSRIGFEATNQYGYIPYDLIEKILNCRQLMSAYGGCPHIKR